MKLEAPADFRFESAVCSHGFFLLAPNRWNIERRALHTAVPDDDGGAWAIVVDSPKDQYVRVRVPRGCPSAIRKRAIVRRVRRILRMDEDLSGFHRLCATHSSHAGAARGRFGRLIRSASLFEDMVKVICTCNITWKQTVGIVDALVRRFGMPAENDPEVRAFPDANGLASARLTALKAKCSLGYRAEYVRDLARAFVAGRVDPAALESCGADSDELYKTLRQIRGIGDYAAGPSHVLPTSGTARFASGLSANSFLRSSSVIYATRSELEAIAGDVRTMAEKEGLTAHRASVDVRFEDDGK